MKDKKTIIILAIVLAVIVAAGAIVFFVTRPATEAGVKSITVVVTHKDKSEKSFYIKTAREYLADALLDEKVVEGSMSEYGLYISKADGEVADYSVDGSYWALYINGEYAMTGASETPVADGGIYSLIYTIYTE